MALGFIADVDSITIGKAIVSLILGGCLVRLFYNLHLHPLRHYPGPLLARATSAYSLYLNTLGIQHTKEKEWHDKYGDVVRCAPNYLSYSSSQAWKEIHGYRTSLQGSFDKDSAFFLTNPKGVRHIVAANGAEHRRLRRLLAPAFSDKALQAQEPIIQSYVDHLIQQLRIQPDTREGIVNIVKWFNFTTFDIIGDLSFGEPFGLLNSGEWHRYVTTIFGSVKVFTYLRFILEVFFTPLKELFLVLFVPKRLIDDLKYQTSLAEEKLKKRMESDMKREDFVHYILKGSQEQAGEDGLTFQEMVSQAQVLLLAGSETTATSLSGMTYYLLKTPTALEKLTTEIRSAFTVESDITILKASQLPYLQAVLNESLRMYPPAPNSFPRVAPYPGEMICGRYVPGGISVGMHHYSSYRSRKNFVEPNSFIPERWIMDETRDPKFDADNHEAYHPFSTGTRNCLGRSIAWAELRLIVCKLFYNFDLALQPDSEKWIDQPTFGLWEKGPLNVRIKPIRR
ncbi:cytochrome P450 CYP3/CYP5/CYP6/CYP9 [Talaromyces proteolyticus]|uniref:Cytochrome P450 CYP3/CYP5/CYP6/CYP9 n=1 Tax=Talaromyces proteolyticus TaxID=1131652 RepID=A0AAD4L3D1_9EURO|nr:cytochrome P450 CYP3/CYP5/CYP6/CYP9 [Talaromyces proteolyticus]KAH8705846.1 cytochrome P450 CYP3/CYP5/CYP6/CYP9 [Talaromyces proteolyticus]